jgi:DNA modification methylase
VGSGFGKNISNWLTRDKAFPANVLHLATECSNKKHSAAFPEELPEWFIKLFTKEGDTVLDPFMGSGTSVIVANRMKRNAVGIDVMPEYFQMVTEQLKLPKPEPSVTSIVSNGSVVYNSPNGKKVNKPPTKKNAATKPIGRSTVR